MFLTMDSVSSVLESVPQSLQLAFAGLGALFVGSQLLGFLRFFLNVFILSGTNVSVPYNI